MSDVQQTSHTQKVFEEMKTKKIQHWHKISIWLAAYDLIAVCISYFAGLWLRFDCRFMQIPENYLHAYLTFIPFYAVICLAVFFALRLYNTIWRFASYNELGRVMTSTVITTMIHIVGITVFVQRMPVSYYLFGAMIQFVAVLGIRFSYRFILLEREKRANYAKKALLRNHGQSSLHHRRQPK